MRSALDAEQTKGAPSSSSSRTLIASNAQGGVGLNANFKLERPTEETRLEVAPTKGMGVPAKPIGTPAAAVAANASAAAPPVRQPPVSAATEPISPTSIYRVGPGDMLDIRVLSRPSNSSTLFTILAGGLLEYPLAEEPLLVAGMTTDEIDARLTIDLERRAVVSDPEVIVSVREYGSHIVIISGLVADPGSKIIRREAIPLYVVIADAQPAPEAGLVEVTSHRTNERSVIDLTDQSAMSMLIYPGDVLKVSARPAQFYYIGGNVAGPGQKQFHAKLTLTQAILAAGGSIQTGKAEVRVTREGQDGRLTTIKYNLREIMSGALPDPLVKAGDRIEVVK
ncbi:MAG: polysaccharide biosynthesis/export family protein [Pyrinomonadaceae bacterium]